MIAPTLFQTASHSGERIPDQFGIVGDADAGSVPVFGFSEVLGVAIQKAKAGSVIVDVCHRTTVTERGFCPLSNSQITAVGCAGIAWSLTGV